MCQTLPLLLPVGIEPQFDDPSPSATLRPLGSARPIHLAPSTSVHFVGTVSSPYSPLSRAHPKLPYYCLLNVADVVVPPPPSQGLPCEQGRTPSPHLRSIHHVY